MGQALVLTRVSKSREVVVVVVVVVAFLGVVVGKGVESGV